MTIEDTVQVLRPALSSLLPSNIISSFPPSLPPSSLDYVPHFNSGLTKACNAS